MTQSAPSPFTVVDDGASGARCGSPIYTGAATAFADTPMLRKKFTRRDAFGNSFLLYHLCPSKGEIWVPREMVPMGKDRRSGGSPYDHGCYFEPRSPEQSRVVQESVEWLQGGHSHTIEAPTGFGKTYIGAAVLSQFSTKTLIVVTKDDIVHQWRKALSEVLGLDGDDIGSLRANTVQVGGKPVVIGTIQSLSKMNRYPANIYEMFGLVLFDEVHRIGADTFSQVCWQFNSKLRLGLSATPYRRDGKGVVFEGHIGRTLVRSKALPMLPKVIRVRTAYKVNPYVRIEAGRIGHVTKRMGQDTNRNLVIATMARKAYDKQRNVVIFSDTLAHLDNLRACLIHRGVPAEDIGRYVGGMKQAERDENASRPVVLATYAMASEATDYPHWDTAMLATPKADVKQIVGRVLREHPGKKEPVVFDFLDGGHSLLQAYAGKRKNFYLSLGAAIIDA